MKAWHAFGAVAVFVAFGCLDSGSSSCPDGEETCACYPNHTCDPGLTCASDICVALGGSGGSGGSAGESGSGSGGTAGTGGDSGVGGTAGSGGVGGTGGSGSCVDGDEGCACYPNSTCNGSLTCLSGVCVNAGGSGGSGGVSGTGGVGGVSGTGGVGGVSGTGGVGGVSGTGGVGGFGGSFSCATGNFGGTYVGSYTPPALGVPAGIDGVITFTLASGGFLFSSISAGHMMDLYSSFDISGSVACSSSDGVLTATSINASYDIGLGPTSFTMELTGTYSASADRFTGTWRGFENNVMQGQGTWDAPRP